ncbi:TPA: hypothetical protein DDW35_04895 [Candidatus Sumerlaeota bacterium]|nr:hypothetical protein [Candidatus Sumerlaeota bacterium]
MSPLPIFSLKTPLLIGTCGLLLAAVVYADDLAEKTTSGSAKVSLGFSNGAGAETARSATAPKPTTVVVESVNRNSTLRLTGSLIADEKADVCTNVNGIVKEVAVDRGSLVETGALLTQLDPTDAQNALDEGTATAEELKLRLGLNDKETTYKPENQPEVQSAKAALDLAAVNHKRNVELVAEGAVAQSQVDQTKAEFDSATQRYKLALHQARQLHQSYQTALVRLASLRKAVADTRIVAPFSGWVVEKYVSRGERVSTMPVGSVGGARIAALVKVDPLRLSLTVPQQSVSQIKEGQTVKFQVDGFPGRDFSGTIRYIAPSVASDTRSMTVEAIVPNSERALRPGVFATAELQLTSQTAELYVPVSAVRRSEDVAHAFVVKDGVIREKIVSVGETQNDRVQVLTGLGVGDVLIRNAADVKDGEKI